MGRIMRRTATSLSASKPLLSMTALLLALAFSGSGRFAAALSCMCSLSRCERPTNCSAGVALDACSCCYECARTLNETCGGLFNLLGSCANGLYCEETGPLPPVAAATDGAAGGGGGSSSSGDDDDDVGDSIEQSHLANEYAVGGGGNDFAAVAAPPEVQAGVCVPCKGGTRFGCDLVVGRQCQCGESCSKEFRFDTLEACRSAAAVDGQRLTDDDDSGEQRLITAPPLEPLPNLPTPVDDVRCDEVPCPNDSELFVECPADSWRRPLTDTSIFELCCAIHGMTDECVCKEPRSCPAPPMCDEGLLPIEVVAANNKPGSCCSLYQCANVTSLQCEYKGVWYEHGDEVLPASFSTAAATSAAAAGPLGAASPATSDDEAVVRGGSSVGRSLPAPAASSLGDAAVATAPASCQSCFCIEGQVLCRQAVECPPVPSACSWMAVADGDCCPTCRGCVSRSTLTFHVVGESWQEDDCTHCECDAGGVARCFASGCAAPRCARPLKLPGHCCPVCSGTGDDAASADGSADASAIDDGGRVDVVTYANPENTTDATPHSGTAAKTTVAEAVASMPTASSDVSLLGRCATLDKCSTPCEPGRRLKDSGGCPTCDCAKTGEILSQNDTATAAPAPSSLTGAGLTSSQPDTAADGTSGSESTRGGGAAAARCFTSLGHPRRHGEMWFDGCRECLCDNGRELCSLVACPPLACRTPVQAAGLCCPVCAEDVDRLEPQATNITTGCKPAAADSRRRWPVGSSRGGSGIAPNDDDVLEENREPWRLDKCSVCICHQGRALCETERCPPVLCEKPVYISGRCCPTCPDATQYWPAAPIAAQSTYRQGCTALGGGGGMRTYRHGDVWRASDCQSCTCQHGQLHCFSQTCPAAAASGGCSSTVLRKGQCCPICAGDPADVHPRVCVVNDQVYLHGQEWTTACSICMCYHGNRHCAPRPCTAQLRGQMMACGASHPAVYYGVAGLTTSDGVCCQHCLDAWSSGKAQAESGTSSGGAASNGSGSEVAIVATLAALLCLFACVIVVLVVVVVRRTKRRSASVTLSSVAPELLSMTACGSSSSGAGSSGGVGSVADARPINNRPAAATECALRKDGSVVAGIRRPKSTNLEFYIGSYRYNNTALKDKECCKPLVEGSPGGGRTLNDYVLC